MAKINAFSHCCIGLFPLELHISTFEKRQTSTQLGHSGPKQLRKPMALQLDMVHQLVLCPHGKCQWFFPLLHWILSSCIAHFHLWMREDIHPELTFIDENNSKTNVNTGKYYLTTFQCPCLDCPWIFHSCIWFSPFALHLSTSQTTEWLSEDGHLWTKRMRKVKWQCSES